jgi:hypothetical protein
MKKMILLAIASLSCAASLFAGTGIKGLEAKAPAADLADKLMLFGQFVDNWECDVVAILPDGSKQTNKCEWNWGWILGGRAIQDVYMIYSNDEKPGAPFVEYGTTLRVYDTTIDAWHVIYAGPIHNNLTILTARKKGDEIVLETGNDNGRMGQWIFSEITKNSFHWRAQGSSDGGKTWHVIQEMQVWRVSK